MQLMLSEAIDRLAPSSCNTRKLASCPFKAAR